MSTRERWIVYPLLFLTLGIALRDKFVGSREMRAEHLTCNELRAGHLICDRLESGQSDCRALIVRGPNGRPVVAAGADAKSNSGAIETFSPDGMPLVQIESAGAAGIVVLTGHVGQEFGIFAQLPELGLRIPIATPWRYDGNRAGQPPPRGAKATPSPTKQPPEKPDQGAAAKTGTNNRERGK